MENKTIAFIFGVILIGIGILGGGFQLRELNIPKVGWFPRFFSIIVGAFFIVLGVGLDTPPAVAPDTSTFSQINASNNSNQETVTEFIISDILGDEQISEQVSILIDGKFVGTLTVNQDFPESMIRVTVPRSGTYTYTAEAVATFAIDGSYITVNGAGQGNISVEHGRVFDLVGSISGNTWYISLQQRE